MKDKRGVLRGRCLECPCGEYEPQKEASSCDYCGHAPGQHVHVTKDVETPPAEPETQAVYKFEKLPEKRKLSLGWLPHPKTTKTLFHNNMLPAFYEASYPVCNDKLFQKDLIQERNRSFKIREKLDHVETVIEYVCGPNPAAGGRFLQTGFKIKGKHDIITCNQNIEKLAKMKGSLDEEMAHVEEHDNTLFKKDGLHLRPGQASKSAFNAKMKARIKSLLSSAESAVKRLEAALKRLRTFFDSEDSDPSRANRMKKQRKRKAIKKKAQRKKRREEELMQDLFPEASPDLAITANMVVVEKLAALNHLQGTYLYSLLQRLEASEEARSLVTANLGAAGRRGFQEGHRRLHADCRGDCASVDCHFYEQAAIIFRSLGGQTYRAMYAPSQTGLPQLSVTELEADVLAEMEFTPELAALIKAGCFDEEAASVVREYMGMDIDIVL